MTRTFFNHRMVVRFARGDRLGVVGVGSGAVTRAQAAAPSPDAGYHGISISSTQSHSSCCAEPSDPLNSELYERAMQAWSGLKSDLWFHLELENALVFWWSGLRMSSGLDFVGELSREQREIQKLVRQIESGAQKEVDAAVSQARAFIALINLLERHIERYEARVFLAIRKAVAQPVED
jgi:Hemerythrin HHE cation binding domain